MAVNYVCPHCGDTENVVRDAYATWNIETQEWELLDVYDTFSCNACGEECREPDEVVVDESEEE